MPLKIAIHHFVFDNLRALLMTNLDKVGVGLSVNMKGLSVAHDLLMLCNMFHATPQRRHAIYTVKLKAESMERMLILMLCKFCRRNRRMSAKMFVLYLFLCFVCGVKSNKAKTFVV
jgi:arginine/lysine/ornithine decarboxylase